jgi:recombination protein RecR
VIALSPSLEKLITEIAKLPGLGRKSAARLALFILRQPVEDAQRLADAILDVKNKIHLCTVCANLTEDDICSICSDHKRDHGMICVVETPGDVITLEKTGAMRGLYHVLGGALSPLYGIGPADLRVQELFNRVKDGSVREVILATNPTPEGDATALFLAHELNERKIPVSRIARGVPIGAELENVDEVTLARALEGRTSA